jgi:hypothetical protein
MSHGWNDTQENSGYKVSVLTGLDGAVPDSAGILTEPMVQPYSVRFKRKLEVPLPEDAGLDWEDHPEDYPGAGDDETLYHDLVHIPHSKLGGWPTWVQAPGWPHNDASSWFFVGQLDAALRGNTTWVNGGYAYLFVRQGASGGWEGELTLQTT